MKELDVVLHRPDAARGVVIEVDLGHVPVMDGARRGEDTGEERDDLVAAGLAEPVGVDVRVGGKDLAEVVPLLAIEVPEVARLESLDLLEVVGHRGSVRSTSVARPEGRLNGKVVIVTGSTRGIGRATAVRFAEEGAAVVVTGRTEDAGREVEAEIRDAGGEATYVRTDLAKEADVVGAVRAAIDTYGKLTTLVNNAAPTELMGPGRQDRRVTELENNAWDAIMLVALKAVVWACKHAIPEMAKAGADAGSSIVNISSAASMLGTPGLDTYTAAKGALNTLTRSMAVEYAADGIRSNCIVSGMVLTSEGAHKMMEDPVIGGATRAMHLTRLGLPDDIANAALFLASDEAAFITGAVIPVDGGVTARMPVPDISAADIDLGG